MLVPKHIENIIINYYRFVDRKLFFKSCYKLLRKSHSHFYMFRQQPILRKYFIIYCEDEGIIPPVDGMELYKLIKEREELVYFFTDFFY